MFIYSIFISIKRDKSNFKKKGDNSSFISIDGQLILSCLHFGHLEGIFNESIFCLKIKPHDAHDHGLIFNCVPSFFKVLATLFISSIKTFLLEHSNSFIIRLRSNKTF